MQFVLRGSYRLGVVDWRSSGKVRQVLDSTLVLHGRAMEFRADTPLLGALPELELDGGGVPDYALEEQVGITVEDDDIDGAVFATFGRAGRIRSASSRRADRAGDRLTRDPDPRHFAISCAASPGRCGAVHGWPRARSG